MSEETTASVYVNSRGEISPRVVIRASESEDYIQGFCVRDRAFKTFRKDRVLEYVDDEGQLAERYWGWLTPERAEDVAFCLAVSGGTRPSGSGATRKRSTGATVEVCFTGFKAADKGRLR